MEHEKTVAECERIARTMDEDSDGHEMAGCPMGRSGHYIYGGSGDDTVYIDRAAKGVHVEVHGGSGRDRVVDGSSTTELAGVGLLAAVAVAWLGMKALRGR